MGYSKTLTFTFKLFGMIVGVLKEPIFEKRVSLLPEHIPLFTKKNLQVIVEQNAGISAFASDNDYLTKGATIDSRDAVFMKADVILSINCFEITQALSNKVIVGVYQPLTNVNFVEQCVTSKVTCFSMDKLPRTTRAQAMDVLSSQANIAGYKAVLAAANLLPHYFPMLMTAAGSIAPTKVLILGAGVAGLQAIATAKRLGAVVEVFDTRPAVKEEVQSLGAKFIEVEGAADASKAGGYAVEQSEEYMQKQQQKIAESVAKSDVVITTAQIPGKKAPILITNNMINAMKPGSVIVDLAAATGGNTPQTKNNETVVTSNEISIIGNSNFPVTMPYDASKLYGKNIFNFLQLIATNEGNMNLNFNDELVKGACVANVLV